MMVSYSSQKTNFDNYKKLILSILIWQNFSLKSQEGSIEPTDYTPWCTRRTSESGVNFRIITGETQVKIGYKKWKMALITGKE